MNMKKSFGLFFTVIFLVIGFISVPASMAAVNEKKDQEAAPSTNAQIQEAGLGPAKPRIVGKLLLYGDIYEGFDNNVNLDSSRKHDMFTEADAQLGYKVRVNDEYGCTLNYYLDTVTYHQVTDASFYDNSASLDLNKDLFEKKANLGWANSIGYNLFPNDRESTYLFYDSQLHLKHNLAGSFYQRLTYDFIFRDYGDRHSRDGSGLPRDPDRKDIRNSVSYELAGQFKDVFLKLKDQFYVNDSNDQFMDYFDYWSNRVSVTAIAPIVKNRLHALVSAGYQRIQYDSRQLVDDSTKKEHDNTYDVSSSLVYDITKQCSVSVNYTYRQNGSNEPSSKYSGSIISAGFHYAF